MPKRTQDIIQWSWLPLILAPVSALALGIRIPDQDAEATARGNAFAATADDPSAIYYNPAGITQLQGQHAQIGAYSIWLNSHYTGVGGTFDTKDKLQSAPQMYYTWSPASLPLSFGLGFYSPYGLSLQWPDNASFNVVGTRGQLTYLTLNPVMGWRINSSLSIAAGPTISYADADLRQGAPANYKLRGNDTDAGFNVGLLWKPHPKHALGVTYRSQTTFNLSGHSTLGPATSPANARFPFPQNLVAGWSFRPTPAWNLEFDVDWTDWSRLKSVLVEQPVFGNAIITFNWRSSFIYEWGVTRTFDNGYNLSAGYIFSENSVPDQHFSPLVPDSDRHIFSVGLGRQFRHLRLESAYQFAYGPPRTVNSTVAPNTLANGTYRFFSHALTFSVGYSF